jgi:murein DD-endopeptidase MepM/ murein hydrolase activator NlpD
MKTLGIVSTVTAMIMLWGTAATAHHSAVQFDFTKTVAIKGVVKKFEAINPHMRLVLHVKDAKGERDIEFEGHSTNNMYRAGYRHKMINFGDTITVTHEDGVIRELSRRISDTEILSVTRGDDGFAAKVIATPLEIRTVRAHGTIDSSLFVAARAAGVSAELVMRLANDIFGWKIDFALEIQPGDRFDLVYEQKYRDGEYIGDGRILAADFINEGALHRAVFYQSSDGKIADYFAPDGRSMRRQFLRAPLDFTRISSNFNLARKHPILNTIRAHKGVDYAAPTGTVIRAAGDGRVEFVGIKGGYGNVVILAHGAGITTLYGHMSRFAKGLRTGQRVSQAQTIGLVGSTGAATGPHLHYEYRLNGVHKNPRTVTLPDAAPIPAQYMSEFHARSGALLAELDRARDGAIAATPAL